jgi:sugar lactone lactonase YvrE
MPKGISLDGERSILFVADTGNSRIQVFDYSGKFLRVVEAPGMAFKTPQGMALSDSGEMAISDPDAGKVWLTTV